MSEKSNNNGKNIGPYGIGTDDIAFDDQHVEKELENAVELWRMETSTAHDIFKILLTSDQTSFPGDDTGKPDVLASQSVSTKTSICAPTSANSARSSNIFPNKIVSAKKNATIAAGAAFGHQRELGGLQHSTSFLSAWTAEMKVNPRNAISREVREVLAAAAVATAKTAGVSENINIIPLTFEEITRDYESCESMSQYSFAGFNEVRKLRDSPEDFFCGIN